MAETDATSGVGFARRNQSLLLPRPSGYTSIMTTRLLIDGIMRQTTVLIAEPSTNAGLRAPLAHVADQVFVNLAREIEAQGVSQKVVADMFGLALRTYSARVNKLAESKSITLRDAIVRFLATSDTRSATWSSIDPSSFRRQTRVPIVERR